MTSVIETILGNMIWIAESGETSNSSTVPFSFSRTKAAAGRTIGEDGEKFSDGHEPRVI